jgi:hypothetical protein
MARHNRNQPGPYSDPDQEGNEKLGRRGDIFDEGEPRDKDFDPNRKPLAPPARDAIKNNHGNERNHRRSEYYGSPYDVGNYASHYDERAYNLNDQRIGFRPEERESRREDFRGKGPRAYKRPDKRVLEDINDRLYLDPYIDASDIEVDVEKGDVILKGTVKNRDVKRRAEDIAETVMGVKNVENRLRVANTNERIVSPVRSNAREELM